jgi:RimJ/RimL family protein N-acetyltransferase
MIRLVSIGQYDHKTATDITWQLLQERPVEARISHDGKTRRPEHNAFVSHHPYRCWFLIENEDKEVVGAISLSWKNEIGIAILKAHAGRKYAKQAIEEVMKHLPPLPPKNGNIPATYVANVAPGNKASIKLFQSLGAKVVQQTFQL